MTQYIKFSVPTRTRSRVRDISISSLSSLYNYVCLGDEYITLLGDIGSNKYVGISTISPELCALSKTSIMCPDIQLAIYDLEIR